MRDGFFVNDENTNEIVRDSATPTEILYALPMTAISITKENSLDARFISFTRSI
jgi:hypothetical protein